MPSWVLFFVVVIGLPMTLGIAADMLKRWMKLKEKQLDLLAAGAAERATQQTAIVERLEARVRVLERIATDRGSALAGEIEALRDERVN
jgi:hypothetical protein